MKRFGGEAASDYNTQNRIARCASDIYICGIFEIHPTLLDIMGNFRNLLIRFGLAEVKAERTPIRVFLLDDDRRRHRWFEKRFMGDDLDVAETVEKAIEKLGSGSYDAIFLDHDLLPHHYESNEHNDFANTGMAVAEWLNENTEFQKAATIIVHTRNADAAIPMVMKLRESGRSVEYCAFPMLDLKIKNYWKR